jgi:hypothetical protein
MHCVKDGGDLDGHLVAAIIKEKYKHLPPNPSLIFAQHSRKNTIALAAIGEGKR